MKKRLVEKLSAVSESGKPVTIHVFQDVIDTSDMRHGRSETLGGLKDALTADGRHLTPVDEKTFQIVATGELLHLT